MKYQFNIRKKDEESGAQSAALQQDAQSGGERKRYQFNIRQQDTAGAPAANTAQTAKQSAASVKVPQLSQKGAGQTDAGEFTHSGGKIDLPSLGERVGKTVSGAGKQYVSGLTNAAGLASAGQGGTGQSGVYREQEELLDEQIAALEASLESGALTDRQRQETLDTIGQAKQQRGLYGSAVRSGEETAGEVYKLADEMANSGAEDIERAKEGLGTLGRIAVDTGVAGAQMLGDAALGTLTGSGLVPMFLRSAGGAAQEARMDGASHEQQANYGLASGALSVATEKIANIAAPFKKAFGGGVLDKAIDSALARMNGSAAGKLALSFLSEGGEEVVEDLVQPLLQGIYNGKSVGENYSELELSEVLYDGLIGSILGGLGGGVEVLGDRLNTRAAKGSPAQDAEQSRQRAGGSVVPLGVSATRESEAIIAPDEQKSKGELSGGKRADFSRYVTEQNAEEVSRALNDGTLAVDAGGRIYRPEAGEHIDRRTSDTVGERRINAFQFDHPEVHSYYREAAAELLEELNAAEKGGETIRVQNPGPGEDQYFRTKRLVSERIARLLDDEKIGYADIERALNAIINDEGQENYAAAKRVELMLDNMLTNGYRNTYGEEVAPNADYLAAKQAIPGAETAERVSEELPVWDVAEPEDEVSRETAARRAAQVRSAAAALGQNGSRALTSAYNENTARSYAPEDAVRDFYQVYNAALNGTADSNTTAPDYLRLAAQNAGERDARVASQAKYFGEKAGLVRDAGWRKAKLTSRESYALDALGKVTGTEIRFADTVENGRANASYRDGVMTLALDAKDPVMVSAVHETVHRLRETSPEAYTALADFVQANLSEESTVFNLSKRAELYETGDVDVLTEETVADAFGQMLEKSDVLAQFATEHRSAARKLMDALHDLIVKIKRALNGGEVRLSDNQRAAFRDLADKVGKMESLFSEALETTKGKENAANEGGAAKFSLKAFGDGTRFVDVQTEQEQFNGLSDAQKSKKATQIIKNKFIGKVIGLDNRVFVNGKTASEYGHPVKRLTPEIVNAKMRASTELDNLIDAGTNFRTKADGADGHLHPNAVGDFQYFDTIFKVGNEYYKGVINIEPVAKGLRLKDVTKIENITQDLYNSYGANPKSVFLRDASTGSIDGGSKNVNGKFSLKTDSEGRQLTEAQEEYFKDSKVRDAEGRLKPVYHGTSRADRVGNVFRPERATSGPMAFFTDSADIAQNYSRDKSDTSISYDTDYDSYETQFRTAKDGKSISLIDVWRQLPFNARRAITERAGHVRMDMDGDGEILYDADTTDANGGFSWQMKEARGNTLAALNEQWLNSGMLYNEEERYIDVLREAGVFDELEKAGYDAPKYYDPNYREEKVYKEYLNITSPFNAQEQANEQFLQEFSDWYDEQDADRYNAESLDADFWDKRNVSAESFIERVRDDIENGTSRAWTSIPDSVTDFLKESGYDGIIDKGGKNGGEEHTVYIPFSSEQVKNVDNLTPTSSEDIRYSRSNRELLDRYVEQYGEIPSGEKSHRTVRLPLRTAEDKYVSRTIRTVLEAKATPDAMVPTIEDMVADGKFSYDRYTDKQAVADAESKIKTQGWQKTLNQWKRTTKSEVSKEAMATGWALYNNAATSGDVETALEVLNDMVAKSRNAAQALQAVRILKQQDPSTQLYGVQRSVESLQEELRKEYGRNAPELEIDRALAEKFLNARTDKTRSEAMGEIYRDIGRQMPSRYIDKWNAWRYLAMLGNPRTHVRNIMGNAGFAPLVGVKNLVGAGLESAVNAASGGKVGRTKAVLTKKDTALVKAAWNDYANIAEQALGEGKYSERAAARKEIEEGRVIFQTKPLEKFRRLNSAALDAEDVWFSKPHYASALAQYCKANGITAEQITSGKGLEAARNYAIKEAQKATYRDTNAFSQMVSRMGRANSGDKNSAERLGSTILEGVLPFRKTPANILVRGVEYSPIELLKSISYDLVQVKRGRMEATEMLDHLSTGLTGTGVMVLGAYMAAEGLMGMRLRGSGGGDEDKKDFDELRGHQDYSLELSDGTSITLDWLAPEVLPLFVGANLVEQMQERSDGELTIGDTLEAVSNVSDPLLEMSCLQSLNDLFDSVGYAASGETSALASVVASAATSYLTQALPTLLGQVERTGEDTRMTTYTDKNNKWLTGDMQYALGRASSRLPAWDYNQIPYIDAWGRTESSGSTGERAFNNFLNPAYTSTVESNATEDELERLYEATGERSVLPDRAERYFTVDGERKDLTGEEYVKYAVSRGQTAYRIISELVSSSAYKALDESDKVSAIEDAYSVAKASAKMQVSGYEASGKTARCIEAKQRYGIDEAQYILLYQAQNKIESLKDSSGETIKLSEGLLKMELIYQQKGLSDAQRTALFEAFDVPKSIRHYNKALVTEKLKAMRKKAK